MISRVRYEVLDGLRGVAAVGVMLFHFSIIGVPFAPHGYLAVDFFFILSGFVMAHAYSGRLDSLRLSGFLKLRLIRMLPLSIAGLLVGSLYFIIRLYSQNSSEYNLTDIIYGTLFNAVLLPKPWSSIAPTDTNFTTNTPLWSLSLEMFMNIVWAVFLYKSRSIVLLVLVVGSGGGLCALTLWNGSADLGATWPTYIGGVARAGFGFLVGVILWRYRPEPNKEGFLPELSAVLLLVVLFVPETGPAFDLFTILLIMPAIIYMAACADYRKDRALFKISGDLSYPLYVIHVPVLQFLAGFAKTAHLEDYRLFATVLATLLSITTAMALDKLYDRPTRRILTRRLIR